jgi:hypothetical protein
MTWNDVHPRYCKFALQGDQNHQWPSQQDTRPTASVLAICNVGFPHVRWQLQENVTSRSKTQEGIMRRLIAVHESASGPDRRFLDVRFPAAVGG